MMNPAMFLYDSAVENQVPTPGLLISGHDVRGCEYAVERSRGTRDFYLSCTLSGRGYFRNGEEHWESSEGEVVLIIPGTPHDYGTAGDTYWETYWCHFTPREDWIAWLRLPEKAKGIRQTRLADPSIRERFCRAFARLIEYNAEAGKYAGKLSANALEEMLLLLSLNAEDSSRAMDSRIKETLRLLSLRYKEPFTVASLAAQANLSPSRFAHLFKEQTGESVMDTLLKIRLRHAANLLEKSGLSIADIAAESGFNSPFYFTRQFTAFYGCPPMLYRKASATRFE
jgi:AraC family transcriptional regulator of arabinose operon